MGFVNTFRGDDHTASFRVTEFRIFLYTEWYCLYQLNVYHHLESSPQHKEKDTITASFQMRHGLSARTINRKATSQKSSQLPPQEVLNLWDTWWHLSNTMSATTIKLFSSNYLRNRTVRYFFRPREAMKKINKTLKMPWVKKVWEPLHWWLRIHYFGLRIS